MAEWKMEAPAVMLAERIGAGEVLRLEEDTAGIVMEQDGVDYILTMTRCPKQRARN